MFMFTLTKKDYDRGVRPLLNCTELALIGFDTFPDDITYTHLTKLWCSLNDRLTSLPEGMIHLTELYCDNCNLTTLPEDMVNLKKLYCSNNNLISLPKGMVNLNYLDCCDNDLILLPDDMVNLFYLDCSVNNLSSLPESVTANLLYLDCNENTLDFLPDNIIKLRELICSNNYLTSLPNGMDKLINLFCENNCLTFLPDDLQQFKLQKQRISLTHSFTDLSSIEKEKSECAICLEDQCANILLECNHTFCKVCITSWCHINTNTNPICPLCRQIIDITKAKQIR
jgi:hypothetical protein